MDTHRAWSILRLCQSKRKRNFLLRQVVETYSSRISNTDVSIGDICLSVCILLVADFCNCTGWKIVTLFPKGLDICPFVIAFGRYQDSFSRFTTVKRVKLTHPSQSSAEVMNAWSYRPTSTSTCIFNVLYITNNRLILRILIFILLEVPQ